MTPHDYQQFALSTYCAPEHVDRHDYLMHLLFEEVGEVMSLFAKSMRDGHAVDRDTLLHELGDVLWCVAVLDNEDVFLWDESYRYWPYHGGTTRLRSLENIVRGYDLWDVADLCACCGFTLEEVALANVAKLTSRRERGVLKGSGDNR